MLLAIPPALAQALKDVPAGARAVTVHVCDGDCDASWNALSAWSATLRMPVLDFEQMAVSLRDDRLTRFRAGPTAAALVDLPYTVSNEELFTLLLAAAQGETSGPPGCECTWLEAAANVSRHRPYNLPAMPEPLLKQYMDLHRRNDVPLRVESDAPGARVFVDGNAVGVAPVDLTVPAGWHRVTVERPGRRTAWVAHTDLEYEGQLLANVAGDDSNVALERVVSAAMEGVSPPDAEVATLTAWARDESLEWVRFVSLGSRGADELVPDPDPTKPAWRLRDVYLDVARGRIADDGPGTNAMIAAADAERFRIGAQAGYLHLAPRDHVTVDLAASYRLAPTWAVDVRLGLAHSAQEYFLYDDWVDNQVYPLSLGARYGRSEGGPYAGLAMLAVVPFALGGEARVGWDFAPSLGWRIAVEARGGVTDRGWLAGGGVGVAGRR